MERILRLKHWHIAILLLLGIIIRNLKITNAPTLSVILLLIGTFIYISYPLIIGVSLQEYLPKHVKLNYNLFLINSFICIVFYAGVMIISNGKGMTFYNLAAIPILYIIYALIHLFSFPAQSLKTIEISKRAELRDYVGDFFLLVFLPIGIWFLQPRINKIIEEKNSQ